MRGVHVWGFYLANIENKDAILDIEKLTDANAMLSIHGIAWWDEIHIQQICGEIRDFQMNFSYDVNGILNPKGDVEDSDKVCYYYL